MDVYDHKNIVFILNFNIFQHIICKHTFKLWFGFSLFYIRG